MKIFLLWMASLTIAFALGFGHGSNWTKTPIKEPIPEWYQEYIESYLPLDPVGALEQKADALKKNPKSTGVKEPNEKLQPKLFKSKKGDKNE